jgi:hypothetical protein
MTNDLQEAIRSIKAGDKATGKHLLAQVLKADRDNATAWLWLSTTMSNIDERRRCLKEVLRINPNHPQATAALAKLQAPPAPQPTPAFPDLPPADEDGTVPTWIQQLDKKKSVQPVTSVDFSSTSSDFLTPSLAAATQSAKTRRGLTWYEIWFSVLPNPSEKSFAFILSDPKLSLDRGLIWMFCTALIQYAVAFGLVMVIWLPMLANISAESGMTLGIAASIRNVSVLLFVVGVPVFASFYTLMFALQVGIQHLVARLFGGQGSYENLLFATAAYQAPLLLISIVAIFIPYINFCAGPILGIYTIVLMLNSLRAVYRMDVVRALTVIFLPGIVMFLICCVVGYAFQGPIQQLLMEQMLQITPVP